MAGRADSCHQLQDIDYRLQEEPAALAGPRSAPRAAAAESCAQLGFLGLAGSGLLDLWLVRSGIGSVRRVRGKRVGSRHELLQHPASFL